MSTWSVVLATSAARRSISDTLAKSAGIAMAWAPGRRLGSAFSARTASSHACPLRDVMYIFEQPACIMLWQGAKQLVFFSGPTQIQRQKQATGRGCWGGGLEGFQKVWWLPKMEPKKKKHNRGPASGPDTASTPR